MHKNKHNNELTILVVDDDQVSLFLTTEAIKKDGYNVIQGMDGQQAVDLYHKHLPDLIILDVEMPLKDGFDACKEIRQHEKGADIPIIMVTGLEDTISVDKAYEIGATDFITKPINWSVLGHRIRYIFRANLTFLDLKTNETRLANAHRIAKIGYWEWVPGSPSITWSNDVYHLLGYNPDQHESMGDTYINLLQRDEIMHLNIMLQHGENNSKDFVLERQITGYDQQQRILLLQGEIKRDSDNHPIHLSGSIQDITERRNAEDRIRYLAYYDALTDLPNREYFKQQLSTLLSSNSRNEHQLSALLLLDIDRFKQINDSMGHIYGDELIQRVAERIRNYLRDCDLLARNSATEDMCIARFGGDEFIIYLSNLKQKKNASIVADRLLASIGRPFTLNDREINITASIGMAFYPDDADDADALLKNADTAVHAAKEKGRNYSLIYSRELSEKSEQKLSMENALRQAVKRDELIIHYQPQVDSSTETVVGAEALIRWEHPVKGHIPPGSFIHVAEETGVILSIGKWVLTEACRQLNEWHKQGHSDLRISVNVSSKQFLYPGFVDDIKEALAISGLSPWHLDLELTEGALMGNGSDIIARLNAIKMLGVTLSLDDFGTGYSSLSYLTRFPLDTIKIDRSFVMNIGNEHDDAIVKTIIAMARSLDLNIISEGVETDAQLDFLRSLKTQLIQGYYFSKPLPANEFTTYIQELNVTAPTQQMSIAKENIALLTNKTNRPH